MKKILILTLGVGSVFGKAGKDKDGINDDIVKQLQEMIKEEFYPYDKTDYVVEISGHESGQVVSSEFVAEIQIKEYQPDMIILIGTVKSCWSMFYRKFTQNSGIDEETELSDILQLYRMEQSYGKEADHETLDGLEKTIQQIYNGKLTFSGEKVPDIKVCLIRYGMNNEELLENYRHISDIEKYLDKNEEYDVAFDITHSFRSLPVYNLIILNYLQQVSSYNMKFSHIFYGNFEVRKENNWKAPLVDLADMIEVLNLTNAVSEFKNTGNAASLIRMLPADEGPLISALQKFDWATQINGRNEVINAVRELSKILNEESTERNRFVDIKNMLKSVLGEGPDNLLQVAKCENKGEAQLLLAQWYQKQNRYGLAVTTAMEALRSFLVPYYLKHFRSDETDCENEGRRKEAVQRLNRISESKDNWIKSVITDFLVDLEYTRKNEVTKIRNVFAHNLEDGDSSDPQQSKDVINAFIQKLKQLNEYLRTSEKEFETVYCYEPEKKQLLVKHTGENIRVFISEHDDDISRSQCESLKKSKNSKKRYTIYQIPLPVVGTEKKIEPKAIISRGCIICEYLKRHFEIDQIHIVFDGRMMPKKWLNYAMILYKNRFSDIWYLKDSKIIKIPKPAFEIPDPMPEYYNEKIMELDPIKIDV